MPRALPLALVCIWAAALTGCGGGGSSAPTSSAVDSSDPQTLLLHAEDLSGGSDSGEAPPESCNPVPILERSDGATAITSVFVVGSTNVAEAVGVFDTPAKAAEALESLSGPERLNCIGEEIAEASSAKAVNYGNPKPLDVGDKGSRVHYLASSPRGSTDVISMKSGSCVAALLIGTEGATSSEPVAGEATEAAGNLLADGCEG